MSVHKAVSVHQDLSTHQALSDHKVPTPRLPDFGPLEIDSWKDFLEQSKECFEERWGKPLTHKETLDDFTQLKLLGSGGFGNVILIKHKQTNDYFAMKILEKARIIKSKQLEPTKTEKLILQSIDSPFTLYMLYFFKDNTNIYMVMPFIPGGELFCYLQKVKKCDEAQAKFYASQIILALEYLHFLGLVYRDLKPENILIDPTGYLKLTDFGFCKRLTSSRTYTVCGTPEYMAPEIILSKGYAQAADWWAIGVFIYELVAGASPFYTPDTMKLYDKIISMKYTMPNYFSSDLKDLVKNTLQSDLSKRFGNLKNGVNDFKEHKWFRSINWLAIVNRKTVPKYRPRVREAGDTGNFDTETWVQPKIEKDDKYSAQFEDF